MDYNDYPTPTNLEAEEWRKETLRLDAELKQSKADLSATVHTLKQVTCEVNRLRAGDRSKKVEAAIGGGVRVVSCLKGHLTTQPKNERQTEGLWMCGKCGEIAAEFTTVNYPEAAAAPAAVAVELAQLSRELVQHSREMREQEKKIVELEKQRDMFKESSEYLNGEFFRMLGVLVKITEGKEDAIALAREAIERKSADQ